MERVVRAHPVDHQAAAVAARIARAELLRQPREAPLALLQLRERLRGQSLRGDLRHEPLELCAHEERLVQVVVRERAHAHAAVRLERDEAERREPAERLADGRARDAEPLGELLLPQHRAGRELAGDDRLLDQDGDVVGLRAFGHGSRSYADVVRKSLNGTDERDVGEDLLRLVGGFDRGDLAAHARLVEAARPAPTTRPARARSRPSRRPPSGCRSPPRRRPAARRRRSARRR